MHSFRPSAIHAAGATTIMKGRFRTEAAEAAGLTPLSVFR